jgi:DNA-binding LytR/AlgR family response regulator
MSPLEVVIVDDERVAVRRLARLLRDCGNVVVTGTAENAAEAKALIERNAPDLVLLDIEMPGMNGVSLAEELKIRPERPAIIFVTAFSRFALEAFDVAATDYLLKPVEPPRLAEAIDRVLSQRARRAYLERIAELEALVAQLRDFEQSSSADSNAALWMPSGKGQERVAIRDILWLQAERDYVRAHTHGRSYFMRGRLGQFEERLAKHGIIRVHRSAMVRASAIARILPRGDRGYQLVLFSGAVVDASRRFAPRVRELAAASS